MTRGIELTISDELYEAIDRAVDSKNKRKLTSNRRNAWVEAVLADAARKELGAEDESPAITDR